MEAVRLQVTRIKMTQGEIEHLKLFTKKMVNREFSLLDSAMPCLGLFDDEKNDIEMIYVALCNANPEQSLSRTHNFITLDDDEVISIDVSLRNRITKMRQNIQPSGRRYGFVGSEKMYPLANKCFQIWLEFLDALDEEKNRGLR